MYFQISMESIMSISRPDKRRNHEAMVHLIMPAIERALVNQHLHPHIHVGDAASGAMASRLAGATMALPSLW